MNTSLNQANKSLVWNFWEDMDGAAVESLADELSAYMGESIIWHGPDPLGNLTGIDEFLETFWKPFRESFQHLRRQTHIFMAGQSSGRIDGLGDGHHWVGGTGLLDCVFKHDWLGIPATGRKVRIRWGEFCRVEKGVIVEIYVLFDLIDLMQQAGFQVLPPSRGADGVYPPPAAGDGCMHEAQAEQQTRHSLEHIRTFLFDGLNSYDQSELSSMGMAAYFKQDLCWYGPGGIGACSGLKEFEGHHQKHWLHAYPDRQVQNLDALIAEGPYTGAPGWAGVKATHTGQYLDASATGLPIEFNGIDFWKREKEIIVENWVFVDMIHLFRQFGIDLFDRMKQQVDRRAMP